MRFVFPSSTERLISDTSALLLQTNNGGSLLGVRLVGLPTWTDNNDGTATVTFTTSAACYAGVDYGTAPATYTKSAFDYSGAGPALELATSHTVPIPDALAGGTEADGTYYFRVWMNAGSSSYSIEYTGTVTSGFFALLNDGSSKILLNDGTSFLQKNATPNAKIKDMTNKATLVATDQIPINDVAGGNADKQIALSALKTYVNS